MADQVTTSLAEAKVLVMQGLKGDTGYSPQIEVLDITGGHQIRITTKISPTQYESQVFNVLDGAPGQPGTPGASGLNGADGFSPTVEVQDIVQSLPGGGTEVIGHKVIITDANGPHIFNVMDGEDGEGGGGSDYDPDEELAKAYKLTVSGTTVTLNDTAVNVSAAIQSARPVLFYTESGGAFTFFDVLSMNYSTGEIKLRTPYDSENAQSVTLRPSGSTMTGTLETTDLSAEIDDINRTVYALTVSGTTASLDTSIKDFYDKYSAGLTPAIYLPYGGAATDPIAMEMRLAYIDMLQNSITLRGEHDGNRYEVTLSASSYTATPMTGTLVTTPIPAAVTEQTVSGWGFTKNTGDYTKPASGIPKTDLSSDVQTSLGKADTALQEHQSLSGYATETWVQNQGYGTYSKPSGGIPASDLASGVIPVVPQMATDPDMSDWTSGKTVDAAVLATDFGMAGRAIGAKYTKPNGGIPKTDLASDVQTSLGKADTALQSHQSLAAYRTSAAQDTIDAGKLGVSENAYRSASIPMGELDSTSTATVMTATVPGITELRDGVCMWLKNGKVTSAAGFTVNINNLGAKPCYSSLAAESQSTTIFNVNYTMLFIYNSTRVEGGCWDIVYGVDTNTTYTPVKLGFGYGTCTTAAATAAKTASISSYALTTGGIVSIKFGNDVPANATLNITSKGAKAIYHRGAAITAGVIKAGDTATFVYSTYYHLISIDRDEAGDTLPAVTASDNGKFLRVVSGAWAAQAVPSAESNSFGGGS